MASSHLTPKSSKGPRHVSVASLDTNASGIAESTISLGLSRFPEPPASIPTTPLRSEFSTASPVRASFVPGRKLSLPQNPTPPASIRSARSHPHTPLPKPPETYTRTGTDPPQTPYSQVSPFDWHDGASSIAVDAAEERLLPTSFITSLLEESKENVRQSKGSDVLSGISEMTYPPVIHRVEGRIPPSAWQGQYKPGSPSTRMSGDSETLHSIQGHHPSIIRTASISRGARTGVSVVGYAPATLRAVSDTSRGSMIDGDTLRSMTHHRKIKDIDEEDENLLTIPDRPFGHGSADSPALPSTAGTYQLFPKESPHPDLTRNASVRSERSIAPSFASRISSLRRLLIWRRTKPLPPVPIIGQVPTLVDPEQRRVEDSTPLPDLVTRASHLHSLLEKGRPPHHSLTSHGLNAASRTTTPSDIYHSDLKSKDDAYYRRSSRPDFLSHRASEAVSAFTFHKPTPTGVGLNRLPRKRRLWCVGAVVLVAIAVAVGAGVGVSNFKKKQAAFNCPGNFTGSTCTLGTYTFFLTVTLILLLRYFQMQPASVRHQGPPHATALQKLLLTYSLRLTASLTPISLRTVHMIAFGGCKETLRRPTVLPRRS